jgi:nicotinamidase-related amidase
VDPRTSALLVVDLQNDTVGEQGALADDGAAAFAARHGVLEKAKRLVAAARSAGMPVVSSGTSTSRAIATRRATRSCSATSSRRTASSGARRAPRRSTVSSRPKATPSSRSSG